MIAHKFRYELPGAAAEAVQILARSPERTTIMGGGTWVVPEMSQHKRSADVVVDLRRAGLGTVTETDGEVRIGAAATYSTVIGSAQAPRLLRELASGITGGAQVRNQGTVGGSACYANPASDVPGALVALQARMVVRSASGTRHVPAGEFFVGAFTNCLAPGEMLEAIVVAKALAERAGAHMKFKVAEGSWPIVTATCVTDEGGEVDSVVIGAAAAVPVRVALDGGSDVVTVVREAITEPWSDVLATGPYRRHVAGVLARRVVDKVRNGSNGEVA